MQEPKTVLVKRRPQERPKCNKTILRVRAGKKVELREGDKGAS